MVAYQSLSGAVKSMSVVAAELGVDALQRRVTGRLGLGDTGVMSIGHGTVGGRFRKPTDPLRCALRCWLCWELFFDSERFRD